MVVHEELEIAVAMDKSTPPVRYMGAMQNDNKSLDSLAQSAIEGNDIPEQCSCCRLVSSWY
jgi:hypothetical protein